jgi:hypothetical protein
VSSIDSSVPLAGGKASENTTAAAATALSLDLNADFNGDKGGAPSIIQCVFGDFFMMFYEPYEGEKRDGTIVPEPPFLISVREFANTQFFKRRWGKMG